jgi:hypothetical protein
VTDLCIDFGEDQGSLVSQVAVSVTSWACVHVVKQIQVMGRSVSNGMYAYCSRGLNKYSRAGMRVTRLVRA